MPGAAAADEDEDEDAECRCGFDGDYTMCINGLVYAPCKLPNCNGVCETTGQCACACHVATPS